jgi:hypothetical protein
VLERSRQWTEADLLRLIATQVLENIALEYKGAAALGAQDREKREIAKDVSAFANSAGGVLVYGMAENGHNPTQIEPVNPNPFSKEWLENVIISNVQPRIDGLHINPVQLTGTSAGRVTYVVTVPQSLTAHQAPDNKYYKRFNFQSVPMEHYEVQDAMNRAKTPIVDLRIKPTREIANADLHRYSLSMDFENSGTRAARHMKIVLWFPRELQPKVGRLVERTVVRKRGLHGEPYEAREYMLPFSDFVLFPMDTLDLGRIYSIGITFDVDRRRHEFLQMTAPKIEWTIFADDMLIVRFCRFLSAPV